MHSAPLPNLRECETVHGMTKVIVAVSRKTALGRWYNVVRVKDGRMEACGFLTASEAAQWARDAGLEVVEPEDA